MDKSKILNLLYKGKEYSKIKELLKNSNESWSFNILAKIFLQEVNIENALIQYQKAKNTEGIGYCYFIMGDIKKSQETLLKIKDYSSFTNWILFLGNFIIDNINQYPTYMQIRNFYEQDLEMLINAKQLQHATKIIKQNNFFEKFNREVYKYSARVLFNHNFNNDAENFLKKSIEIYYNYPETHYILGEIYLNKKDKENAIKEFKTSENISGEYMPANKRLKDLLS